MDSDWAEAIFWALVGGPACLTWGLTRLKHHRLMENVPTSRVRSAAMGLVELKARPGRRQN
jgi:hypothetical protein